MANKFDFDVYELNEILGWNKEEEKHSDRYNRLREKFDYMLDEQFDEVYRAFYEGSSGLIRTPQSVSINEAKAVCVILNALADADLPVSFSDVYYKSVSYKHSVGSFTFIANEELRDRLQKIIDALEKTHKVEGLRVIKIMTQGKCHIKLYEVR